MCEHRRIFASSKICEEAETTGEPKDPFQPGEGGKQKIRRAGGKLERKGKKEGLSKRGFCREIREPGKGGIR